MPRPRHGPPLNTFFAYMIEVEKRSRNTAINYHRAMRQMFHRTGTTVETLTPPHVEAWFQTVPMDSTVYATAMNAYAAFSKFQDAVGKPIPLNPRLVYTPKITLDNVREDVSQAKLPVHLMHDLVKFICAIHPSYELDWFPKARRAHLSWYHEHNHIPMLCSPLEPKNRDRFFTFSEQSHETLQKILAWGDEGRTITSERTIPRYRGTAENPDVGYAQRLNQWKLDWADVPLIPEAPGSMVPLSVYGYETSLKQINMTAKDLEEQRELRYRAATR